MAVINNRITILIIVAGILLLSACSGANAVNNQQPEANGAGVQQAENNAQAQPITTTVNTPVTNPETPPATQKPEETANRVDVIYFHAVQRCVTCRCFEQHISSVIDKYYEDALNSGKLTYKVLNVGATENKEIATRYGAVGSQMFINVVIKGVDDIKDIQDIWSWKCTGNPVSFERKVKTVIDQALLKVP